MMAQRTANISNEQKRELVNFIENHPQLVSGKFASDFTWKAAQKLWQQLEKMLNALPGALKDWRKWRKTWHGLKAVTKSKKCSIEKHRKQTGGGSPTNEKINDVEEKILYVIGPTAVSGHRSVMESAVPWIFDDDIDRENNIVVEGDILGEGYILENNNTFMEEVITLDNTKYVTVDHLYCGSSPKKSIAIKKLPQMEHKALKNSSGNMKCGNTFTSTTCTKQETKSKTGEIRRLEKSISATEKLAEQMERKIDVKENYYNKKLKLYEEEVATEKRIANALEELASAISNRNSRVPTDHF